jgi:hypothetical protein
MFVEEIKQFLNYMDIMDTDKLNQASLTSNKHTLGNNFNSKEKANGFYDRSVDNKYQSS